MASQYNLISELQVPVRDFVSENQGGTALEERPRLISDLRVYSHAHTHTRTYNPHDWCVEGSREPVQVRVKSA